MYIYPKRVNLTEHLFFQTSCQFVRCWGHCTNPFHLYCLKYPARLIIFPSYPHRASLVAQM